MAIAGHFKRIPPIVRWLNSTLLQKGTTATFRAKFTGLFVWDDADNKAYYSNGTTYETVLDVDAVAATPSLRTLGTGSQQASAGNHSHA